MRLLLISLFLLLSACATPHEVILDSTRTLSHEDYVVVTSSGEPLDTAQVDALLRQARVVYLGERHDQSAHHRFQAWMAERALAQGPIVIALEMFTRDQQEPLDAYARGDIDEAAFLLATEWDKNWGFPYAMYRPLLSLAERAEVGLLALNAPRTLSRAVFQKGVEGLSDEERAQMPRTLDASNTDYRAFLAQALAAHMPNPPDEQDPEWKAQVDRFMNAQLVWDETMAERLVEALQAQTEPRFLVAAGAGHVRYGWGIPNRVERDLPGTPALRAVCISVEESTTAHELEEALDPEVADIFCLSRHLQSESHP